MNYQSSKLNYPAILLLIVGLATACGTKETNSVFVKDLTCEYLVNPLGIDVRQPRLAWKIDQTPNARTGQLQTAYQILVASTSEKLSAGEGDLWNSGIVKSNRSIHVVYEGKPVESMQQCWWKVKIWNNHGEMTAWSEPSRWGTGVLQPSDWKGQWIGDQPDLQLKKYVAYVDKYHNKKDGYDPKIAENPPLLPSPLLRKSFPVDREVKNAFLYVSSLGNYEIYLNGERVGDHQLAPEWTDYYRRIQYQVYDLTGKIGSGVNVLSAILADGWYLGELGPVRWIWDQAFPFRGFYGLDRRLMAQLCIERADGSRQIIATDGSWKINPDGFIRTADNFVGQTIDARKIIPGWNMPGFDDSSWANVYVDTEIEKNLEAQKNEPIRIHRELKPVEIIPWRDKYIINFGQNIAGWCALKVKGKKGTVITLRHGEWLNDDGSLYTVGLGQAKQTDVFILSGEDDYFEPRFTYHGFQYVEVSGMETTPAGDWIVAKAVSSDPEVTGSFECSNPKLNQLFSNILWTQRNNMHSIPTDCPQRDERCGWLGDAQVFCQNSIFNMNMAAFYTKFIKDMRDAIAPNGQFYSIVPSVKHGNFGMDWYGGPAWADAGVIIPWRVYENYADRRALEDHYAAMKRYVESILSENPDYLWKVKHANYNDWLNASTFSNPPEEYNTKRGNMPDDVFNTAFFAHSAQLLSEIANVLDNKEDALKYDDLRNKIADAFVKNFVDKNGKVAGNSQGAYAIALHFNLLPEQLQSKAFDNLLNCIEEYDYRISTGFVTTPMMMKELVRRGRTDIAYKFLESERFPSWVYAINQGATTIWERWDAYVKGRGIHPSTMNSFDHYSIGSVGEWMYRHILGINPDINYPGYEHFTIHPRPGGTFTWAKGSYNSIRGEIAVSWKIEDGQFVLNVTIPGNTKATIVLPDGKTINTGSGEFEFKAACTGSSKQGMDYGLPAESYKTRMKASDPATWKPVVCPVSTPEGNIELSNNSLFKLALERNTNYLLNSFSIDHLLVPFRIRSGNPNPPDDRPQVGFWDTDLRGSNAGRFMMGAGNTLRWMENGELRSRLNELIDGIEACREPDGYILAYPHVIDSLRSEEPNYARAWFTHGLIEAAIAGNPKAYGLLRSHADWFNQWNELHPKLLYWSNNSHQGHIASTRTYLSPIGKPEDLQLAEKYYVCDWWMDELAARHDSAVWQYPLQNPHSYLITSFEAYLDHYIATGDKTYLNAMLGVWDLIHDKWEHVGGSIAICENQWEVVDGKRILKHYDKTHECGHPPYSYYLGDFGHTGETCGSVFWIKFNQRLHRLFPKEEKYMAEIEKSIYNVILACQTDEGNIRYHAVMEGRKEQPRRASNSCCEGQGTRMLGSLPEYIYSIASDGLYVNLFEPSTIRWKIKDQTVALTQETHFPFDTEVNLKLSIPSPEKMKLRIRVPSWAAEKMKIAVNGKNAATGNPGTYVELAQEWKDGDRISFTLPITLKTTKYTGFDSIPGLDRYAAEYGPILLAAVSQSSDALRAVDINRLAPESKPLHFYTEGNSSISFMPYWLISDETYSIYPLNGNKDAGFVLESHLSSPGFTVEFFNNERWEGEPVYRGTVPAINYLSESQRFIAPKVPVEFFSSRFTGEFVSPQTGTLIFTLSMDDGHKFMINDQEISQSSRNGEFFCPLKVVKGEKYKLKLEHSQRAGAYRIQLTSNFVSSIH